MRYSLKNSRVIGTYLHAAVVPEVSANKYALNIRFTNPPAGEMKSKIYEHPVAFDLTFCNL